MIEAGTYQGAPSVEPPGSPEPGVTTERYDGMSNATIKLGGNDAPINDDKDPNADYPWIDELKLTSDERGWSWEVLYREPGLVQPYGYSEPDTRYPSFMTALEAGLNFWRAWQEYEASQYDYEPDFSEKSSPAGW